jgi:hypothetical protein
LQLLEDRPRGSTVTSTELLERFNEDAAFCPDCREEGRATLKKFSATLAQEVEKAIAQACIKLHPHALLVDTLTGPEAIL